ncbi:MAG: hypothetical protein KGL16_07260 [Acidobacteriota bacterium]|nr:hypothetical protein [Acidobacteriota bacterium]
MELFLMVAAMSLLGVAVCALAFGAATRTESTAEPAPSQVPTVLLKTRFFVEDGSPQRLPVEALLLQIERHVQLEQAAAESFLSAPTADSLHVPSMSPLVH